MARPKKRLVEPDTYGNDCIQLRASPMLTRGQNTWRKYKLFIDGQMVENVEVETAGQSTPDGIWFLLQISDEKAFERLSKYSLRQLPRRICEINFVPSIPWARSLKKISFIATYDDEDLKRKKLICGLEFHFVPSFENWKNFYTPSEYFEELSAAIESEDEVVAEWVDGVDVGIPDKFLVWFDASLDESIIELRRRSMIELEKFHYLAERQLSERLGKSILTYFEFPDAVRVPCEQYLIYFAQFLKDLDVDASTELRHEAGRILFSAPATGPQHALHKIKTALEVFLRE